MHRHPADDFLRQQLQGSVAVDNGKKIGDTHHLNEQGGGEAGDHGFDGEDIALKHNGNDHGKADGENANVRFPGKAQDNGQDQGQQGDETNVHSDSSSGKYDAHGAAGMHGVQGGGQDAGHIVKVKFDDGVAVLVGYVALPVVAEAEEPGGLAQTGIEAHIAQVAGNGINAVYGDAVGIPVGNQHEFPGGVYRDLAGIGIAGDGFRHGGELLEGFKGARPVIKPEEQNLVALFLAHIHPAVVGVDGGVAGLIPGPGEKPVRLGECAGLVVVAQSPHLAVAMNAALGAGEKIIFALIPKALVDGGYLVGLLALIGVLCRHPAQGAVCIPGDGVQAAALQGGNDDMAVFPVYRHIHGILPADVNGVQMLQGVLCLLRTIFLETTYASCSGSTPASISNFVFLRIFGAFKASPSLSPTLPMKR